MWTDGAHLPSFGTQREEREPALLFAVFLLPSPVHTGHWAVASFPGSGQMSISN